MGSIAGQFFKQFGVTISVQVFFSLLAARFVTPVLAAYFPEAAAGSPRDNEAAGAADAALQWRPPNWSVRHHYFVTVALGVVLFVLSIFSTKLLPSGFLPAQDISRVRCWRSSCRRDRPWPQPRSVTEEISQRLRKRPEVKSVFVDGGRIPPGDDRGPQGGADHQLHARRRSVARSHAAPARAGDRRRSRDDPRHPLLVPRRERDARRGARRDGAGRRDGLAQRRLRARARRCSGSAHHRRHRASGEPRSTRSCASSRAPISPRASASRPKPCPRPSASPRSATSRRRWPI